MQFRIFIEPLLPMSPSHRLHHSLVLFSVSPRRQPLQLFRPKVIGDVVMHDGLGTGARGLRGSNSPYDEVSVSYDKDSQSGPIVISQTAQVAEEPGRNSHASKTRVKNSKVGFWPWLKLNLTMWLMY